jgi:mutator protein MutT
MKPIEHFHYCPKCGQERPQASAGPAFACQHCGFLYYFNPAIAAAAFVLDAKGQVLFIRRAKDPGKGKLAVPGGFIDAGETAEEAVRREIREEVNLNLRSVRYLCSRPNQYPYKGVTYPVLDLFLVAEAEATDSTAALDGVESYCWLPPHQVKLEEVAFTSMQEALQVFLAHRS